MERELNLGCKKGIEVVHYRFMVAMVVVMQSSPLWVIETSNDIS